MRIAVWHDLPTGGGLRVLDDQLRGLARAGHELHVWTPPTAAPTPALEVATTVHEVALDLPAAGGARAEMISAWRGHREDLDAFAAHSERCADEMRTVSPDVVFAHSCRFYRVPAIARFTTVPSAVYLHEANRRLYEAPFGTPWVADPPRRRRLRPADLRSFAAGLARVERARIQVREETDSVAAFDEVLVNSHFSRESILAAYARTSRVCMPGIDLERFPVLDRPAAVRGTVLCVGALVVEKNPVLVVEAVAAARPAVRRLVWVANHVDDRVRTDVEAVARRTGVEVDLRTGIPDADLLDAYAEADLFVYAPRLEPFGLAPLEANATGLAVVAVAEGGVRETVVDGVNGVVAEPDPEILGAAIARLLSDGPTLRALGRSGRARVVEHFSVDAAVGRVEQRLRAVAERAARPGT